MTSSLKGALTALSSRITGFLVRSPTDTVWALDMDMISVRDDFLPVTPWLSGDPVVLRTRRIFAVRDSGFGSQIQAVWVGKHSLSCCSTETSMRNDSTISPSGALPEKVAVAVVAKS